MKAFDRRTKSRNETDENPQDRICILYKTIISKERTDKKRSCDNPILNSGFPKKIILLQKSLDKQIKKETFRIFNRGINLKSKEFKCELPEISSKK